MADSDREPESVKPAEAKKQPRAAAAKKKTTTKKKTAKKVAKKATATTKTVKKKAVKKAAKPAASRGQAQTAQKGPEEVPSRLEQTEISAVNETTAAPLKKIEEPKIDTKTAMLMWVVIAVVSLLLIDSLSLDHPAHPDKADKVEKAAEPAAPMTSKTTMHKPPKRAEGSPPGYWLYIPQGPDQSADKQGGAWRYIPYWSEIAL